MSYKKILCTVDPKADAQAAIRRALELARAVGAELKVLHVVGYFPEDRSNEYIAPENQDPMTYELEAARRELAGLAVPLGVDEAVVEVSHSPESASHEVLRRVKAEGYDLVISSGGHPHGLARLLPNSADRIAHGARCDVLVVHGEA